MRQFNFIYKTTNLITGKSYIGKHSTNLVEDGYLGSGKYLSSSIQKYGRENFKREVLCYCNTIEELNTKEKENVKFHNTLSPNGYNLLEGGDGGFNYLNNKNSFINKTHNREYLINLTNKRLLRMDTDLEFRSRVSKTISVGLRKRFDFNKENNIKNKSSMGFLGKTHKDSSKKIISEKLLLASKGQGNSQFGTIWINNPDLKLNRKIKKSENIPDGWIKGRKIK